MVFGGSWGAALALAYAEAHPQNVSAMVVRGIWTGTAQETRTGYGGGYMRDFLPEYVAAIEAAIPKEQGGFDPQTLHKIFAGDDEALQRAVMAAWLRYASAASKVHVTTADLELGEGFMGWLPSAIIDTHYAKNAFFLAEGQLFANAHRLGDIPTVVINGRHDLLCPPSTAYGLHKLLPKSRLVIVEGARAQRNGAGNHGGTVEGGCGVRVSGEGSLRPPGPRRAFSDLAGNGNNRWRSAFGWSEKREINPR